MHCYNIINLLIYDMLKMKFDSENPLGLINNNALRFILKPIEKFCFLQYATGGLCLKETDGLRLEGT